MRAAVENLVGKGQGGRQVRNTFEKVYQGLRPFNLGSECWGKNYSCKISSKKGCEPSDKLVKKDTAEVGKKINIQRERIFTVFNATQDFTFLTLFCDYKLFFYCFLQFASDLYMQGTLPPEFYCRTIPSLLHLLQNSAALQLSAILTHVH